MTIMTSKYSKVSALALAEAMNTSVYNPYQRVWYKGDSSDGWLYNMGCSFSPFPNVINDPQQVAICINKVKTFQALSEGSIMVVPWTYNKHTAQSWLDSDRIVVNRKTLEGKSNDGLSYSYKNIGVTQPDVGLSEDAAIWTRYVNHNRELRAYVFKGKEPQVFEKVIDADNNWIFEPVECTYKLKEQLTKAQQAFSGLVFSAYDILECVTGDYYFLENNSAPTLVAHDTIIPALKEVIYGCTI